MVTETQELATHSVNVLIDEAPKGISPYTNCTLALLVEPQGGQVTGHGRVLTWSPWTRWESVVNRVTGTIHPLGLEPALRIVKLEGLTPFPWTDLMPPASRRASPRYVLPGEDEFAATLLIQEDSWNGRGSFTC